MDFTEQERIWQWCDTHQELLMQYFRAHAKDASQIELVSYDPDKMKGVLTVFNWQGVRKIVSVKPETLIAGLEELVTEIEVRCNNAADAAEGAATYANAQGDYAKQEAARVQALIDQLTALGETVRQQGNTAAAQGNAAEAKMNEVAAWYTPFKNDAESWYSGIVRDVTSWFNARKSEWTEWFNGTCNQWTTWFGETADAWTTWNTATVEDWDTWFAARKAQWSTWWNETTSSWSAWFADRVSQWDSWYNGVVFAWDAFFECINAIATMWEQKEKERQAAEEIRQEIMSHPPIPSERGYWMFWSLETTPHSYVESGYSSRGTIDWPEFFWDYGTMGIGVITERDYSRFFIDEQGRFGMLM